MRAPTFGRVGTYRVQQEDKKITLLSCERLFSGGEWRSGEAEERRSGEAEKRYFLNSMVSRVLDISLPKKPRRLKSLISMLNKIRYPNTDQLSL